MTSFTVKKKYIKITNTNLQRNIGGGGEHLQNTLKPSGNYSFKFYTINT